MGMDNAGHSGRAEADGETLLDLLRDLFLSLNMLRN